MTPIASRFADLEGAGLHYLDAGAGDVVALVHGIPRISHEWRHVVPRLAERYRVIAPDLRGLGGPSRPAALRILPDLRPGGPRAFRRPSHEAGPPADVVRTPR